MVWMALRLQREPKVSLTSGHALCGGGAVVDASECSVWAGPIARLRLTSLAGRSSQCRCVSQLGIRCPHSQQCIHQHVHVIAGRLVQRRLDIIVSVVHVGLR